MPSRSGELSGYAAPGFEPVREAFAANLAERGELGAAFAAWHDGRRVVDLWAVRPMSLRNGHGGTTRCS